MEIEWRKLTDWPKYEVSNTGLVRHVKLKKILKPRNSRYFSITFTKKSKKYCKSIHRLVLEAFKGPCPDGMIGCHNDGDRYNNNIENLRWATQHENMQDALRHGTRPKGENHGRAKLKLTDVNFIRYLYSKGLNQTLIAKMYKVKKSSIHKIVRNKLWKVKND